MNYPYNTYRKAIIVTNLSNSSLIPGFFFKKTPFLVKNLIKIDKLTCEILNKHDYRNCRARPKEIFWI